MPLIVGDLTATLWSTTEAAEAACVKPRTIRNWVLRKHLAPAGLDNCNRPLYRAIDVIKAERKTRERARRSFTAAQPGAPVKRHSKDLIKSVDQLGFDHVSDTAQGYLCFVHPGDPQQTELLINPSINDEHTARTILRRAQRIAGAAPRADKRQAGRIKERAEADRERARERLELVRAKQARSIAEQADAAELSRVARLVRQEEQKLAALERLMTAPPQGGSVHRGNGQVRHCAGGRR